MAFVVLESVWVLVPLPTDGAEVGFLDLHPQRTGIGTECLGIQNRVRSVLIRNQSLGIMTMAFVVFEAILVLVCFLAPNHRAMKGFGHVRIVQLGVGHSGQPLLFPDRPGQFAVFAVCSVGQFDG